MTVYADLDKNNVVINVIVADQEFIDALPNASDYVLLTDNAGIGYIYDATTQTFVEPYVPPKPPI